MHDAVFVFGEFLPQRKTCRRHGPQGAERGLKTRALLGQFWVAVEHPTPEKDIFLAIYILYKYCAPPRIARNVFIPTGN